MSKKYETVIGLEVHVELKTNTKIFCNCSTEFGGEPNTHACPICAALPGSLPVLNEKVVEYAIKAGLATNCEITRVGKQDRKNYFYPDLGKGYQISQADGPICHDGYLEIETVDGPKKIRINRIHIEEDAGKLVHQDGVGSLLDLNRSGMGLIEIVSEPDLRSREEVIAYLQKLRAHMTYIDVSDAKMNEGSFRCDVNLSVREYGQEKLGTRVEMKNMNSFQSIMRAIEFEERRQINAIENGEELVQETRGFNQETRRTFSMRNKENAADYRYLPDPDLMPIVIDDEMIESIRKTLPELPDDRKTRYIDKFGLVNYDAEQLVSSIELAEFFEEAAKHTENYETLANLIISEIFRYTSADSFHVPFSGEKLGVIVDNLATGKINHGSAKKIIEILWEDNHLSPEDIIVKEDLEQISDKAELEPIIEEVIKKNDKAVEEYKAGKEKALQSLIGQVMGRTRGKANPQVAIELLKEKLD